MIAIRNTWQTIGHHASRAACEASLFNYLKVSPISTPVQVAQLYDKRNPEPHHNLLASIPQSFQRSPTLCPEMSSMRELTITLKDATKHTKEAFDDLIKSEWRMTQLVQLGQGPFDIQAERDIVERDRNELRTQVQNLSKTVGDFIRQPRLTGEEHASLGAARKTLRRITREGWLSRAHPECGGGSDRCVVS